MREMEITMMIPATLEEWKLKSLLMSMGDVVEITEVGSASNNDMVVPVYRVIMKMDEAMVTSLVANRLSTIIMGIPKEQMERTAALEMITVTLSYGGEAFSQMATRMDESKQYFEMCEAKEKDKLN